MQVKELCKNIIDNRGKTPKLVDKGYPLIEARCFSNKEFVSSKDAVKFIDAFTYENMRSGNCEEGDILITLVGSIGHIAYVRDKFAIAQNIVALRIKNLYNSKFIFYKMQGINFLNKCKKLNRSSSQPSMNINDFLLLELELPNKDKQDKIAKILFEIDSQIERNNAMVERLQDLAQTIYSRWFNQFEFPNDEGKPYKSSGGKMVWSETLKREIPDGWSVGNLYDIADFTNGLACQKFRPISEDKKLPVVKITEMHNGITEATEFVRDDIPEKNIICDGDILFSWSATLETMLWTGGRAGLNQHIFKVVPTNIAKYYVFMQLSNYIINFVEIAKARKTTMGHITTDHLEQSRIVLPPQELIEQFNSKVEDIFQMIINSNKQNQELSSFRNFLIPLLINGQVGFNESDSIVYHKKSPAM